MRKSFTLAECGNGDARDAIPDDQLLAEIAKALGHPACVQILRLLLQYERCFAAILSRHSLWHSPPFRKTSSR